MIQAAIRNHVLASCASTALFLVPGLATAQQRVVIDGSMKLAVEPAEWSDGLSELTVAVAGTYGDEGPRIAAALDKIDNALTRWDQAIRAFETKLRTELPNAPPRLAFQMRVTLAGMYVERGRLADGLRELDAANGLEPRHSEVHLVRGLVLDATGRSAEADAAFRTAWDLDPSGPIKAYHVFRRSPTSGARDALGAAYQRLLRDKPAAKSAPFVSLDVFHGRTTDSPVLPPVTYASGFARIARGEYAEAITEFRKAVASDPLVIDPAMRSSAVLKAVAALKEGRPAEARAILEGVITVQDSSEVRRVLGLAYWANSQDGRAVEQLEIAIARNPRDERSRLALARVLSSLGREPDAERALQETIRELPGSALARWWLGAAYEQANRLVDARREIELAAPGAAAGRGRFFAKLGQLATSVADFPGAVDAFERSVNANLNDPESHKQLAAALLQQDRADEALVELVAALLIDPLDAGAHTGIGRIHLNAGRYTEATNALRRAVELSPDHTEARYALATALMRAGKTQEAAREFERVEQAQRRALDERRRTMTLDVQKEEEALRKSSAGGDAPR